MNSKQRRRASRHAMFAVAMELGETHLSVGDGRRKVDVVSHCRWPRDRGASRRLRRALSVAHPLRNTKQEVIPLVAAYPDHRTPGRAPRPPAWWLCTPTTDLIPNVSGEAMDLIDTAGFGLTPLRVDKGMAAALLDALRQARKAAKGHKETLRFPGRGDRGAPLRFHGWNTYSNVACAKHDPAQQAKHTCVLYRGERGMLQRLSAALPGFGDVLALASSASPGMEIALVHALFQDSPQACFNWHCDNGVEGSEDVLRTIVILLSDTASSMQVKGFAEYAYDGQGSAVLFDSGAVHRSGNATAGTVKIALFLRPRVPVPTKVPDATYARGIADSVGVGMEVGIRNVSDDEESGFLTPVTVVEEAAGATVEAVDGVGATVDGETSKTIEARLKRKAEAQLVRTEEKLARKRGAIIAPSRTGEGFALATGRAESCLVDAVVDGMRILDANTDVSLATMRRLAIPELGNVRQASWKTAKMAMKAMWLPFELHETTSLFRGSGAPMLNLLKAEPGVYIVGLDVGVRTAGVEKKYRHCICLTTIPTEHAPLGRLVDNSARTKPVYIESADLVHKMPAKKVWRKLLQQSIGHDAFSINPTDVYQLAPPPDPDPVGA